MLFRYQPRIRVLILVALFLAGGLIGFVAKAVVSSSSDSNGEQLPPAPVTYEAVSSRPPAHLLYPGAATVRVIGAGESVYPAESTRNSAFAGAIVSTSDSPAQVYAWYRSRLTPDGWTPYQLAALLSTQISAQGYRRGAREFFVVAIDDPGPLSSVLGNQALIGSTIVEFRYTIGATS